MDTNSIDVFLEVSRALSFAKVAERRGVNASTISRIVSSVEQELGVKLLSRTTRHVVLTEAGQIFASRAALHISDFNETVDRVKSVSSDISGSLKVSASVAFGECYLVPRLTEFQQLYPRLSLSLQFTDQNIDLLYEGIDVAIRLAPAIEKNLVVTRLMNTSYLLCASPQYIQSQKLREFPASGQQLNCIQYSLPQFQQGWRYQHKLHPEDTGFLQYSSHLQVSSVLSMRSLCLQGMGVALLADWLVKDDIAAGDLLELYPDYRFAATSYDTSAWIVYPDRHYVPQKVRVFIDYLKSLQN